MATKSEDVLELIKGMTILELKDLNDAIKEEFGVTAVAPVAVAAAGGAPAAGGGDGAEHHCVDAAGFDHGLGRDRRAHGNPPLQFYHVFGAV